MNQSANILRKDFNYLRSQLLIPCSALLLATGIEVASRSSGPLQLFSLPALARGMVILFCLSWIVVIVNLIHSERLVGLNQFWTTRPYEWPKLLLAKCYFLLLLLYLPLVASQVFVLLTAGLSIVHSLGPLLLNLLLLTATIVLPASCAAALTRTTNQAMLVLLGMFSAFVAAVAITRSANGLMPGWLIPAQMVAAAIVLGAALVHQYRTRKTQRSMQILLLAPLLICIAQSTIPGSALAANSYTRVDGEPPLSVRFDTDPLRTMPRITIGEHSTRLWLHTPLLISHQQPGASFSVDAHRVVLTAPGGYTWSSPWTSVSEIIPAAPFTSERSGDSQSPIPLRVYQRLGGQPVSLRIQFALVQFQDQAPRSATLSIDGANIPNLGVCALDHAYSQISCRSAFRDPPPFAISTVRKVGPCTAVDAPTEPASAELGDLSQISAIPQIDPVIETPVRLTFSRKQGYLCPGLPIQFVERKFQRKLQAQTPPVSIHLNDYITALQLQ